jgi:hypothetical protein
MRRSLIVVLLASFVACDSSAGPDPDFLGTYGLVIEESDAALMPTPLPDGSARYSIGYLSTESSHAYNYVVLTQLCYLNGCTAPEEFESHGTWTADGSSITLKDSDGSSETWSYSRFKLSGVTNHLFKPALRVVFQRCDATKQDGCQANFIGG